MGAWFADLLSSCAPLSKLPEVLGTSPHPHAMDAAVATASINCPAGSQSKSSSLPCSNSSGHCPVPAPTSPPLSQRTPDISDISASCCSPLVLLSCSLPL